ncbi:MAG: hypothetical protein H6579_04970 [Chitinophagales bacterium]|nr:hypothetical protein [Chitinophagales bacterium]
MKKLIFLALSLGTLIVFLVLFYGALNSWPNVEDLGHTVGAKDMGVFKGVMNRCNTHDGRYTTNFMHATNFLALSKLSWYKYYIVFTILCLLASIFAFTFLLIKSSLLIRIFISSLFVSFFFTIVPTLYLFLYGLSFNYYYLSPCISFPLLLLATHYYFTSKHKISSFSILLVCQFISIGFVETYLPLFFFFTLFLVWHFYQQKDTINLGLSIPFALSVITSLLFFVTIPGALSRSSNVLNFNFITNSLYVYLLYFKDYLLSLNTLFAFVLSGFIFHFYKLNIIKNIPKLYLAFFFLIVPLLMSLPYFLGFPETKVVEKRIYAPILFFQMFLAFFFIFPLIWEKLFHSVFDSSPKKLGQLVNFIIIPLLAVKIFMVSTSNTSFGSLLNDSLSGKVYSYNQFMKNRYNILINASNSNAEFKLVCVEELIDFPEALFNFQDLQNDRHNSMWNYFMEAYFEIDEIRVPNNKYHKFDRLP